MPTTYYAAAGQPLRVGHWVVVPRHLRENTPLVASCHWQVVRLDDHTLALQAQDPAVHLQVQLTPELARRCTLIPAGGEDV